MDYSKSATNNRNDNDSSEAGMKGKQRRRRRSAKQVERCRKYRERQSAMFQNNRKNHFDQYALNQHTNTQALEPVPPFYAPCLYIPGATPVHQPTYYFCPGMIPPAQVPKNVRRPPQKVGIVKETQEHNDLANHKGKSTVSGLIESINTDDYMTSHGLTENIGVNKRTSPDFIEIMNADDTGTNPAPPENIGADNKRTSSSLTENVYIDDNQTTTVLTNNISAEYNSTSPDLTKNICEDNIRTSQFLKENIIADDNNVRDNQENEDSTVNDDDYHTGDEETGSDDAGLIDNNNDKDMNGIMSIFVNSSLHCVLNTTSCLEEMATREDFGYAYFTLSNLLK